MADGTTVTERVAPSDGGAAAAPVRPSRAKRRWLRPLLFALLPIALVAGG